MRAQLNLHGDMVEVQLTAREQREVITRASELVAASFINDLNDRAENLPDEVWLERTK